jgi:hypothetical protein
VLGDLLCCEGLGHVGSRVVFCVCVWCCVVLCEARMMCVRDVFVRWGGGSRPVVVFRFKYSARWSMGK